MHKRVSEIEIVLEIMGSCPDGGQLWGFGDTIVQAKAAGRSSFGSVASQDDDIPVAAGLLERCRTCLRLAAPSKYPPPPVTP